MERYANFCLVYDLDIWRDDIRVRHRDGFKMNIETLELDWGVQVEIDTFH